MFGGTRKGPGGGPPAACPSDAQAREKLALYVYEYLHHIGAKQAAEMFLKEIRWDKNITLGEPPGFLHSWWCVFWDLYCAAPERRETCEHSQEAKAFHDYGFVSSGFPPQVNGIHNATPSPIGMPSSGPDGMPPSAGHPGMPGPSGPPFFTGPGGVPIRPSPPQQQTVVVSSQASPHHSAGPSGMMPCISQPGMPPGATPRYSVPRGPGPGQRMAVDGSMVGFPGGHPGMFPPGDQMRPGPGGMLQLQRLPPSSGVHPRAMHPQMNPNNFGAMRPPGGPPVSAGLRHAAWPPSTSSMHFEPPGGQFPAPIMSNGPGPGPGTPGIMPSPQNMPPSDMNAGDRFVVMPGSVGPMGQSFPPMTSEAPSMVGGPGGDQMMMNGDGLDIKNSPSSSQGFNGGTPGPNGAPGGGPGGGPGSVPPVGSGQPGSAESMEFSNPGIPFGQGQDQEQSEAIAKIKASMIEESKHFESKDGVTTVARSDTAEFDF